MSIQNWVGYCYDVMSNHNAQDSKAAFVRLVDNNVLIEVSSYGCGTALCGTRDEKMFVRRPMGIVVMDE